MKDIPVKTLLSEGQYKYMKQLIAALGFTESGYIRHLIITDMAAKEALVSQMTRLTISEESDHKSA